LGYMVFLARKIYATVKTLYEENNKKNNKENNKKYLCLRLR